MTAFVLWAIWMFSWVILSGAGIVPEMPIGLMAIVGFPAMLSFGLELRKHMNEK